MITKKFRTTKVALLAALTLGLATATIAVPLSASGAAVPTSLRVTSNSSWGPTLVLKNGDTVYRLSTDKKNKSNCTGACASAWPPVLLAKGQTKALATGVTGLGSIARSGGTRQVTLDGWPLYRFIGDKKSGQVNGNVKDTWGTWYSINPAHPTVAPKEKSSGGTTTTTAAGGIAY